MQLLCICPPLSETCCDSMRQHLLCWGSFVGVVQAYCTQTLNPRLLLYMWGLLWQCRGGWISRQLLVGVTAFSCFACSRSVDSSSVTCLLAELQAQPVVYVYGMNCIGTQCTLDCTGTALYITMLPVTCLSLGYHHPWQGLMLCYQSQHALCCAANASFGGANEGRKAWCLHKGTTAPRP